VHGANRLGGNSLLETIVFGKLGAKAIGEDPEVGTRRPDEKCLLKLKDDVEAKLRKLASPGRERPALLQAELSATMSEKVGIFRTREELEQALQKLIEVKERYRNVGVSSPARHMNYELMGAVELEYMMEVAHTIILGAILREESRGSHFRLDFSARNDKDWLKHTIARMGSDGSPAISFKEVAITRYQPMERKY
jgi:succinate dehydrogenase / fumarate reductase flavoprotein subunit